MKILGILFLIMIVSYVASGYIRFKNKERMGNKIEYRYRPLNSSSNFGKESLSRTYEKMFGDFVKTKSFVKNKVVNLPMI